MSDNNKIILSWFINQSGRNKLQSLLNSLISGEIKTFAVLFKDYVMASLSYFDTGRQEPEQFYHAFVLGLLVGLRPEYEVKSNRESGYGRYDVMIIPRDLNQAGIIIEFKKVDVDEGEDLEKAAAAFDCYAYEAFKAYAIDYLIKPVNAPRIRQTIRRIKELKKEITDTVIRQCSVASAAKYINLCIQAIDGLKVINLRDIILITRNERKTAIHTVKGTILTNEPLHQVKVRLKSDRFFRCHKGYIINIAMVSEIIPWGTKTNLVILVNTTETALMTLEKVKEFKTICSGSLS